MARPIAITRTDQEARRDTLDWVRAGYAEQAAPIRERRAEALTLERRLAALVNRAYGLTPEEVDLLWRAAEDAGGTVKTNCYLEVK